MPTSSTSLLNFSSTAAVRRSQDFLIGDALLVGPLRDRHIQAEDFLDARLQSRHIPLLSVGILGDVRRNHLLQDLVTHSVNGLADVVGAHDVDALLEHDLALIVHRVVVFEHVLARVEVAGFDLLLGILESFVDPAVRDRFAVLEAKLFQHAVDAVGGEDAHQVVFERQVEFGAARIALTTRAAAKLIVDAPALVALRTHHVETAGICDRLRRAIALRRLDLDRLAGFEDDLPVGFDFFGDLTYPALPIRPLGEIGAFLKHPHLQVAAELNIGAATGHVGRDRHGAGHAGLGDDERFLFMVARVEHLMRDATRLQQLRQRLALLDRDRAHQNRLAGASARSRYRG